MVYSERQVNEVRLKKIESRHYDDLVDLELMNGYGHGLGQVVTEADLVFIRDQIDKYIRENFPPNWETPAYWREDA